MGQLVGCLQGIGEASRALDFPIVSGNVSLYNETMGAGIPPTPSIGGVGLLADVAKAASLAFRREGEAIWLIGGSPGWLGRSAWLATCLGREEGAPPPVDLDAERRNGEFVLVLIGAGRVSAVHDVSDGGLAVALAEMAMAGGIGATIDACGGSGSAARLLLRRGSGTLRRDGADVGLRQSDRGRGPRRRPDASHRRDRRPRIDLAGRSADRGGRASSGVRVLVSRLHGGTCGVESA